MTDNHQIEMRIHAVKDELSSIGSRLDKIYDKVQILIAHLDAHEAELKTIEEKLNDS